MHRLTSAFYFLMITGALLLNTSCSNQDSKLKDEVITPSNIVDISNKIKEDKSMSAEDIDLFASGLSRIGAKKDSLNNKTVGQIIESQKEYMRDLSIRNLNSAAGKVQMGLSISVNFINKLKYEKDSINADGVELTINNLTDKGIKAIKGQIRILNQQNQLVKVRYVDWKDMNLAGGKSMNYREFWAHDNNNKYDVTLREEKRLTAVWVPETIVFSDGKQISQNM